MDERGEPLEARVLDWRCASRGGHDPQRLDHVGVYVHERDASGELVDAGASGIRPSRVLAEHALEFLVEPGRAYRVGAFAPRRSLVERSFSLAPGELTLPVVLHLEREHAPGIVTVEVREPDGMLRPGAGLRLEAPSGRVLLACPSSLDGIHRVALPAGSYRVLVPGHAAAELELEVRAGARPTRPLILD